MVPPAVRGVCVSGLPNAPSRPRPCLSVERAMPFSAEQGTRNHPWISERGEN